MKTREKIKINIDELLIKISSYNKEADLDMVKEAFEYARKAHMRQIRKTGDE